MNALGMGGAEEKLLGNVFFSLLWLSKKENPSKSPLKKKRPFCVYGELTKV